MRSAGDDDDDDDDRSVVSRASDSSLRKRLKVLQERDDNLRMQQEQTRREMAALEVEVGSQGRAETHPQSSSAAACASIVDVPMDVTDHPPRRLAIACPTSSALVAPPLWHGGGANAPPPCHDGGPRSAIFAPQRHAVTDPWFRSAVCNGTDPWNHRRQKQRRYNQRCSGARCTRACQNK